MPGVSAHAEQIEVYSDVMQMVIRATPGEFNATQYFLKGGETINGVYTLKWNLRRLRATMAAALLIPIGLLLLNDMSNDLKVSCNHGHSNITLKTV